jgi:hypothetical protein
MPHIVLLGDSIFDNAAYVDGPDVVAQLRHVLPDDWRATLSAVDGATIEDVFEDVSRQRGCMPDDATHLVVSAGGNDALAHADLLDKAADSSAQVLGWLDDAARAFERRYDDMLSAVLGRSLPTTLCTIYNGNLGPPAQRRATAALAVFNDVVLRAAAERRLDVIELRLVCTSPLDYSNPIEPSIRGGEKIARAILRAVVERPTDVARVYGA